MKAEAFLDAEDPPASKPNRLSAEAFLGGSEPTPKKSQVSAEAFLDQPDEPRKKDFFQSVALKADSLIPEAVKSFAPEAVSLVKKAIPVPTSLPATVPEAVSAATDATLAPGRAAGAPLTLGQEQEKKLGITQGAEKVRQYLFDTLQKTRTPEGIITPEQEERAIEGKARATGKVPYVDILSRSLNYALAKAVSEAIPLTPSEVAQNELVSRPAGFALETAARELPTVARIVKEFIATKPVNHTFTTKDLGDFFVFGKDRLTPEAYDLLATLQGKDPELLVKALKSGEGLTVEQRVPRFGKTPELKVRPESTAAAASPVGRFPLAPVSESDQAVRLARTPALEPAVPEGAAPIAAPRTTPPPAAVEPSAIPKFREHEEAVQFGQANAGRQDVVKMLDAKMEEIQPHIQDALQAQNFQEAGDLAVERQFYREAKEALIAEEAKRAGATMAAGGETVPSGPTEKIVPSRSEFPPSEDGRPGQSSGPTSPPTDLSQKASPSAVEAGTGTGSTSLPVHPAFHGQPSVFRPKVPYADIVTRHPNFVKLFSDEDATVRHYAEKLGRKIDDDFVRNIGEEIHLDMRRAHTEPTPETRAIADQAFRKKYNWKSPEEVSKDMLLLRRMGQSLEAQNTGAGLPAEKLIQKILDQYTEGFRPKAGLEAEKAAARLTSGERLGGGLTQEEAVRQRNAGEWDKYLLTNSRVQKDGLGIGTKFAVQMPEGEFIPVYRAVSSGVNAIKPGDYVTASRAYAEEHLRQHVTGSLIENQELARGGKIISQRIRKSDLGVAASNELIWVPKELPVHQKGAVPTIQSHQETPPSAGQHAAGAIPLEQFETLKSSKLPEPPSGAPAAGPAVIQEEIPPTPASSQAFHVIEPKAEDFKLFSEVSKMVDKYAERVGERYVPRGAEGVFYPATENIRLKALNKVSVAAHEVTHALDHKLGTSSTILANEGTKNIRDRLTQLYVEYYPGGKSGHKLATRVKEGLATLIQKMAETPSEIRQKYPDLVSTFLEPKGTFFKKSYADLVQDAQDIVRRYQALDPLHKIGARVTSEFQNEAIKDSYLNFREKFVTQFVDELYPIERLGKEAGAARTGRDPSLWARMYKAASGLVVNNLAGDRGFWIPQGDGFKMVSDLTIKDLVEGLQKKGLTDDFGYWLVARRQKFAYDHLDELQAKGDVKAYESLKGILDRDGIGRATAEQAYSQNRDLFLDEGKQFDAFTRANLEILREARLINDEQFNQMSNQEGYASFKRDVYDEILGSAEGAPTQLRVGKTKVSSMMNRRGSELTILNPLYSLAKDHAEIVRKSLKQIVYNRLLGISDKFPQLFQRLQLSTAVDKQTGRISFPQEKDPNIIMARDESGKRVPLLVSKEIKAVVDSVLEFRQMHFLERLMTLANRMFSKGTTGAYPLFALTNVPLDQISAAANTRTKMIPIYDALAKMSKALLDHGSQEAEYLREYLALGGERQTLTGWQDMSPRELFQKLSGEKNALVKALGFLDRGVEFLALPGKYSEILTRATEYIKSRQAGNPQIVALEDAGRVSAPFHHMGRLGGGLGQTIVKSIPFFNPGIQGIAQYWRSLGQKETRARAIFVTAAVTASMVGAAAAVLLKGTKDQKRQYMDLEGDLLTSYLWYPHPDGKRLIRIRVPQEMGPWGAIINMTMANLIGKAGYGARDYVDAATAWIPNQFNPSDFPRMFFSLLPQMLKPLISVVANIKDFPRVRPMESASMQRREPRYRYNEHTSLFAKKLGDTLNLSPVKIDYLIEGYMGRTMRLLTLRKAAMNPYVQDWYFTAGRNLQDYYDMKARTEEEVNAVKSHEKKLTDAERADLGKRLGVVKGVEQMLDALRKLDTGKYPDKASEIRRRVLDEIGSLR